MTDLPRLLAALHDAGVHFIVVGGIAATAHGSARVTFDLDVVYDGSPTNVDRIVSALAPYHPYLRGAPPGLPFVFDAPAITCVLNLERLIRVKRAAGRTKDLEAIAELEALLEERKRNS